MNANFSEPKSLFGGLSSNNPQLNFSSNKKRMIGLSNPFNYSDSKKGCFDFNLETV
jgi:hypothetical protein